MRTILRSHIKEGGYRKSALVSLVSHFITLFLFVHLFSLFPGGIPVSSGSSGGGGMGEFVSVGLTDELGGGAGMYKPAVRPVPPVSKPPPEPITPPAPEPEPDATTFVENARTEPSRDPEPKKELSPRPHQTSSASEEETTSTPTPPRTPDPGSGDPTSGSPGQGGVLIGPGSGNQSGPVDSWYIRQVEARVGRNWLKTSLGALGEPVLTVISFEVLQNGRIENIEILRSSGNSAVDLAAERAVRASNPLPALPYQFRDRGIRFTANFKYPQQ